MGPVDCGRWERRHRAHATGDATGPQAARETRQGQAGEFGGLTTAGFARQRSNLA